MTQSTATLSAQAAALLSFRITRCNRACHQRRWAHSMHPHSQGCISYISRYAPQLPIDSDTGCQVIQAFLGD